MVAQTGCHPSAPPIPLPLLPRSIEQMVEIEQYYRKEDTKTQVLSGVEWVYQRPEVLDTGEDSSEEGWDEQDQSFVEGGHVVVLFGGKVSQTHRCAIFHIIQYSSYALKC